MRYTKYLNESRKYLYSLRKYVLFSLYIFVIAIFCGYIFAQNYPSETQQLIEVMRSTLLLEEETTLLQLFFFIFENNAIKLFIILLLGIFAGLIPFFSIFANGLILGVFVQVISAEISWTFLFLGVAPHGIIEIPVLIVSSAIGMKIGKVAIYSLFTQKASFKREFIKALKFFVLVLVPLLFIAALIEAFITTALLEMA